MATSTAIMKTGFKAFFKGILWLLDFLKNKVIDVIVGVADYTIDKIVKTFTLYFFVPAVLIIVLLFYLIFFK